MPSRYRARVELRHLRYFVAVAGELNFTKAARLVRIAQPALSRQIRQLEDEVGVRLLERDSQGVRLTEAGTAFLAEARSLLAHSERAIGVARGKDGAAPAHLDIGYVWGLFHTLAPAMVKAFRRKHPDTSVNLLDLNATDQATRLREGKLDVGFIGFAHEADASGLAKRRIGGCRFVAVLPSSHRLAKRRRVRLGDLAGDFFLGIDEASFPGASKLVGHACAEAGFKPRLLQMAARGHTLLGMVAANCGVALLPETLKALPHAGVVLRPLETEVTAPLFLAWRATDSNSTVEAFLKTVPASA